MMKLFCALTGDDYKRVIEDTPASRKKISILGSVMLIPVIIWFLIASSIAQSMFQAGMGACIAIGVVAAFIIFILERAIVMSGHNKLVTGFRITIGFIVAFLGALFMDELIFEKDIEQQQYTERTAIIEVRKLKMDSIYKPRVNSLQMTLDNTRTSWMITAEDARKEADGSGGSGTKGVSNITRLKLDQASILKAELDNLESEIQALNNEWKEKVGFVQSEVESKLHGRSILSRISSLINLVLNNRIAAISYLLFTVFFFSLEFIVIMMKHALPETNYERRIAAMEQVGKRRLERMIESGISSFDPGDNSEKVRNMESELRKPLPTLFKKSA